MYYTRLAAAHTGGGRHSQHRCLNQPQRYGGPLLPPLGDVWVVISGAVLVAAAREAREEQEEKHHPRTALRTLRRAQE